MNDLQLPREALLRLAREAGLFPGRSVREAVDVVRLILSDEPSDHVLAHDEAVRLREAARELRSRLPASQRVRVVDPRARGFGQVLDALDGQERQP